MNDDEANSTITEEDSVSTAREWVERRAPYGCDCPVCTQYIRYYKRPVNSAMCVALVLLYRWERENPGEWLHVPTFLAEQRMAPELDAALRGGDFAKLRFWGLIESKPGEIREDGSGRAGLWRITSAGSEFVCGETQIRQYAVVFNNEVVGWDGGEVGIRDCLQKRFDYDALMAWPT